VRKLRERSGNRGSQRER